MLGQVDSSLEMVRRAIASSQAIGMNFDKAWLLALAADGCGRAGRVAEGLTLVNEALDEIRYTGDDGKAELPSHSAIHFHHIKRYAL